MTKIVLGLNGVAGAGKSTAAKILSERLGFVIVPFAGPLKRMALAAGWSAREVYGDQKEAPVDPEERFARYLRSTVAHQIIAALPEAMRGKASVESLEDWWRWHHHDFTSSRRFQQLLGTEWGRQMVASDFWLQCWKAEVGEHAATHFGPLKICSDDCRFENEFAMIRKEGGLVVRLEREGAGSKIAPTHISEAGGGTPDIVIDNNGSLDDLEACLAGVMNRYASSEAI